MFYVYYGQVLKVACIWQVLLLSDSPSRVFSLKMVTSIFLQSLGNNVFVGDQTVFKNLEVLSM